MSLSFSIGGNMNSFHVTKTCQQNCYQVSRVDGSAANPIGPRVLLDQNLGCLSPPCLDVVGISQIRYPANSNTFYNLFSITDSTGATHPLGYDNSNLALLKSTDGSGFLYAPATSAPYTPFIPAGGFGGTVYTSSGTQYLIQSTGSPYPTITIKDRDGNSMVLSVPGPTVASAQIVDTLGRVIPQFPSWYLMHTTSTVGCPTVNANYQPTTSSVSWAVPGANGTQQTYLLCYATVYYHTSFFGGSLCCPGSGDIAGTVPALQSIVLPSGTYWTFTYDAANPSDGSSIGYGQVVKVQLPTGGTISYQYLPFFTGCSGPNGDKNYNRAVSTRTLDSGNGSAATWSYNYSLWPTVTATDPLGNDTVATFSYLTTGNCDYHEKTRIFYQGSKTANKPLRTIATTNQYAATNPQSNTFGFAYPNGTNAAVFPSVVTTTMDSGQVTTTTYQYNDGGFVDVQTACTVTGSNTYSCTYSPTQQMPFGRVTSTAISDYTGSTLKTVNTQYQMQLSSSYKAADFLDLVASTTTLDGSNSQTAKTTYGYDENNGSPQGIYGHRTSVAQMLNTSSNIVPCNGTTAGSNLTACTVYNPQGMVTQKTDPNGNTTKYSYDSTGAFLSQIQYPDTNNGTIVHHSVNLAFDPNTGLQLSSTDQNGNLTSNQNDVMKRLTQVSYPDGGLTTYCYTDIGGATCAQSASPYQVVVTKKITSSLNEASTFVVDGFGRLIQTQLTTDPQGTTYAVTTYDSLGRKSSVYNPTRCNPPTTNCGESTWGVTTYHYDALNRVTSVAEPDGSAINTSYSGNCTTVTDEGGKARKSCADGLGRMTGVWEDPGSSPHLNYETDYVYDSLNNLTSVTQKGGATSGSWRNRTFTYDFLSRLVCSANPEIQAVTCPSSATATFPTGAITYSYDNNGNVLTKSAPSPNQVSTGTAKVTTTYTYDALNRLTGKSYSDAYNGNLTLGVTYGYDGANISNCPTAIGFTGGSGTNSLGHRTAMCFGGGSKSWTFDPMGRISSENDRFIWLVPPYSADVYTLNGVPTLSADTSYYYYLNGDLFNLHYPGPKGPPDYEFSTVENAAGQVTSAGDIYYNVFTNATYAPTGQLATAVVGASGSYNGNKISNTYNSRLQPVLVSASTYSGTPILNLTYNFNLGNGTTGSDNGNVIQIANGKDGNRTQNFLYDSLNRIQQAYTNGPNWGETYAATATSPGVAPSAPGIDAWGNLTNRSGVTGKNTYEPLSCSANTQNRLNTCYNYDAAGNLIKNGSANYTYDAENRLIATAGMSYVYDGDGERVEKCTQGTTPGTCASNAAGTFYWLHAGGGTLAQSDLGGNWTSAYGLIRGQIASRVDLPANVVHYYFHDRLGTANIVTDAVGNIVKDSDYYPYGGEIPISGSDSNHYKFTGKERDSESGLDNFGARYDASSIGRFMSPDSKKDSTLASNPQTLNTYTYALNNPLRFVDVGGKCVAPALGPGQVGICIETYIQAARFGFLNLGLGDNRLPVANDPNAKFRTQTLITVDLLKHTATETSQAGVSEVVSKGFDPKQGTVDASIQNVTVDQKGNIHFDVSVSGLNGQKAGGGPVGFFAPSGTIGATFDLLVDPKGTVVLKGGEAKSYPSISIFSYSDGKPKDVWEQKESGDPGDLNKPMQKITLPDTESGCAFANKNFCFI